MTIASRIVRHSRGITKVVASAPRLTNSQTVSLEPVRFITVIYRPQPHYSEHLTALIDDIRRYAQRAHKCRAEKFRPRSLTYTCKALSSASF